MIILSLEQLFEGNQNTRGILARFDGVKKIAFSEPKPFDWVKHIYRPGLRHKSHLRI